jgi:hypothetical protein
MSYVRVLPRRLPPEANTIRIATQMQGGGTKIKRYPYLCFYIGSEVAKKLGWNLGNRVNLFFGTEKHAGMARIERSDTGTFRLGTRGRSAGASLHFKTAQLPDYAPRATYNPAEEVKFMNLNDGLEISLPSWLQPPRGPYVKKHPDKNLGRPKKPSKENGHNPVDDPMDRTRIQ